MATEKELETIRERTSIVDLVSAHTRLKRAGRRFKGLCPFHADKDPSFTVDEERKLWHCFGCGEGGDVFTFVMKAENTDFGEAVEILAKRTGVTLSSARPEDAGRRRAKDRILKINELAVRYFYKVLVSSKSGEKFLKYLEERRVPPEQIKAFRIGASLDSWDNLTKALVKKEFTTSEIVQAGLAISKDGRCYDRFRNRLMFPLFNVVGDPVGFAGRAFGDAMPKYLNTPETPLFDKGKMLYALDKAKKHAADSGIILCEGYMDVMALHRAGFDTAAASMGTALTQTQVDLVRRYTDRVVLSYDADIAGDSASMRGIEMLVTRGFDIKVVSLPKGDDPDSIITKGGPEAFGKHLENAFDYFDFFLEKTIERVGAGTPGEKREVIMQLSPLIDKSPNNLLREQQVRILSNRIGEADKHVLAAMQQIRESRRDGAAKDTASAAIDTILSGGAKVERKLLQLMLSSKKDAETILGAVEPSLFESTHHKAFLAYCRQYRERHGGFDPNTFLNEIHPQEIISILSGIPLASYGKETPGEQTEDVLDKFLRDASDRQIADLRRQVERARKEGDKKLENQLASRLFEIKKRMHQKK